MLLPHTKVKLPQDSNSSNWPSRSYYYTQLCYVAVAKHAYKGNWFPHNDMHEIRGNGPYYMPQIIINCLQGIGSYHNFTLIMIIYHTQMLLHTFAKHSFVQLHSKSCKLNIYSCRGIIATSMAACLHACSRSIIRAIATMQN